MRFELEQLFWAPPDAVARAYADPALYPTLTGLPKLTDPEVLACSAEGDRVHLEVRYRFGGELSAAARAVLDPARLSWVEHADHDLARRTTRFHLVPDHYGDRFRCEGTYRFEPDGTGTRRVASGEVRVKALVVGSAVERAIVSGLREHLADEAPVVDRFLAGSS